MAKIEVTKTELVWLGKYNEDGTRKEVPRVSLPFQVIETINESRATQEAKTAPKNLSLFESWGHQTELARRSAGRSGNGGLETDNAHRSSASVLGCRFLKVGFALPCPGALAVQASPSG